MPFSDGRPMNEALRPLVATMRGRHGGDVVACVIAETRDQARDAADAVEADYDPLPSVTEIARALDADGKFLALRAKTDANLGACLSFRGAGPPVSNVCSWAGVYTTPAL